MNRKHLAQASWTELILPSSIAPSLQEYTAYSYSTTCCDWVGIKYVVAKSGTGKASQEIAPLQPGQSVISEKSPSL